jgi:hypothetical protein
MQKTISKKQKIILASAALVLAASGLSNLLESRQGQVRGGMRPATQYASGSWRTPSAEQRDNGFGGEDPQDTGQQFQDGAPSYANGSFDAGQGATTNGGAGVSDMGSGAVTDGYWDRQASQDGVYRDMDNQIRDQVTVQNQTTGDTFQADAGSDNYYQSPSADSQMGAQTIVGVDAGGTAPSDGTQLSVVTGSDAGATSSEGP